MKEYVPLLEGLLRTGRAGTITSEDHKKYVEELSKILLTGDESVIPKLKDSIAGFYMNQEEIVPDLDAGAIHVKATGDYSEPGNYLEIQKILLYNEDGKLVKDYTGLGSYIEEYVNSEWTSGWNHESDIRDTERSLDDWINKGGY